MREPRPTAPDVVCTTAGERAGYGPTMIWYLASPRGRERATLEVTFSPEKAGGDIGRTVVRHLAPPGDATDRLTRALYRDHVLEPGLLLARRRPPPHDRSLARLRRVLAHLRSERLLRVWDGPDAPTEPPAPSSTDAEALDRVHALLVADVRFACEAARAHTRTPTDAPGLASRERAVEATAGLVPVRHGEVDEIGPELARALARQRLLEAAVGELLDFAASSPALHPYGDELHAQMSAVVTPLRAALREATDRDALARQSYGELLRRPLSRYLGRRLS